MTSIVNLTALNQINNSKFYYLDASTMLAQKVKLVQFPATHLKFNQLDIPLRLFTVPQFRLRMLFHANSFSHGKASIPD